MPAPKSKKPSPSSLAKAGEVIKKSFKTTQRHPQILVYPYVALFFTSATYSIISTTLLPGWYDRVFHAAYFIAPHKLAAILGIVGFSAFYSALVSAYFTCAVSASVLAVLEERPVRWFYGLAQVARNFLRVTGFAFLSVFFFPLGVYAQRRNLSKNPIAVLGSSFTLHMASVAPAVLSTDKNVDATIRDAVGTLGRAWHESLILKIGMYLTIFILFVLPKLIQHHLFKSQAASDVGWLVTLELAASGYVTFKVINSIFTTVLYHQAKTQK